MVQLSNYNFMKNVNFTVILKIFAFIYLSWACLAYNNMGSFFKSLENKYKNDKILNVRFCRLLARHEQHKELKDTRFSDKLPDRSLHNNKRNVSDHIPIYSEVRSKASNNFDIYMKGYKDRYMKKKGISKLDCYYENKIFGRINHIRDIVKKMHNDKKRWKRFFLKTYGLALMLFALIPALGLIYPIVFGIDKDYKGIVGFCEKTEHFTSSTPKKHTEGDFNSCEHNWLYKNEDLIRSFGYVSYIFLFTTSIIVLLIVSYIFIKFIKYEKLKAGKSKMNEK
ncbi:Plasmodium exported protein, unknown function [Plasmodium vivax]|uniref:Fam-l protein n=1 Tax=Plasmodium vivax TaxID=5855 RepID=A0A565A4V3_PLAVI|nr:Plasmodium exported protein, unknown function [Plasmodium vivax]